MTHLCNYCGSKIYSNEQFCSSCGQPVRKSCKNCGHFVYSDEDYCPFCGAYSPKREVETDKCAKCAACHEQKQPAGGFYMTPYGVVFLPAAEAPAAEEKAEQPQFTAKLERHRPDPDAEYTGHTNHGKIGLILGILSFLPPLFFLSIIGLIYGIVGIKKGEHKGLSIAAVVVCSVSILAYIAVCVWMFSFGGFRVLANLFNPKKAAAALLTVL